MVQGEPWGLHGFFSTFRLACSNLRQENFNCCMVGPRISQFCAVGQRWRKSLLQKWQVTGQRVWSVLWLLPWAGGVKQFLTHMEDTHAIDCRWPGPLTCDLSFLQERLRSPLTDCAKFRYSRTYHAAIKIIFPMSPICGFAFLFLKSIHVLWIYWPVNAVIHVDCSTLHVRPTHCRLSSSVNKACKFIEIFAFN